MLQNWALKVFFSLAALGGCATLTACCCDFPIVAKLPAGIDRGTVAGHHFVAVTQTGKVVKVDLTTGGVTDLGAPAPKLSSFIDATANKALVAAPGKALLINLANGKVERSVPFTGETILGLGLIGN